jgi:uncharacterized phage protein (TIGR01671 family)
MREIKFRFWHKEDKKMYYNTNIGYWKNGAVASESSEGIFTGTYEERGCGEMCDNFWKIMSETHEVMQFTGLKDKNGKEIYEGDIVRYKFVSNLSSDTNIQTDFYVVFGKGAFLQSHLTNKNREFFDIWYGWDKMEVIGNIYENPELIKQ